jgi:hypothetical protein
MAEQLRKNRSLAMFIAVALSLIAGLGVVWLEGRDVFKGMSTTQLTAVVCMIVLPIIAITVISYDRKARQAAAQRRADLAQDRTLQILESSGGLRAAERLASSGSPDLTAPQLEGTLDPSIAHDTLAGVEVMTDAEVESRPAGTPQRAHRRRVIHEPAYETPPARAER